MSTKPTTAEVTTDEIHLWRESTPEDYNLWDLETVSDCDGFLQITLDRLQASRGQKMKVRERIVRWLIEAVIVTLVIMWMFFSGFLVGLV